MGLAVARTAAERADLLEMQEQTLALLEQSTDQRRVSTRALADRLATIERSLTDRTPADRRAIVCTRLGISRAHYYRLRQSLKHETAGR